MEKITVEAIGLAVATFFVAFLIGQGVGYAQGMELGKIAQACEAKGAKYISIAGKQACYIVKEIQ